MSPKVLYAERNQLCIHLMKGCLEKAGWDVTGVLSTDEALEAIQRDTPDIVITGVVLLASSGYELCRAIRNADDLVTKRLPLIVLSWHERPEDIGQGFRAGADAYLAKPCDLDEVKAVMDGLLKKKLKATKTGRQ